MNINRRYFIKSVTAAGIAIAAPRIVLADDRRAKWFYDFNDPNRGPTNLEAYLAEVPRGMTQNEIDILEERVANDANSGLDGIVKIQVDEALDPNQRVDNKKLEIHQYHDGKFVKSAKMRTNDEGIAETILHRYIPFPQVIRIVSPKDDNYIESDIECRIYGKNNFIPLSLFRKDYNLKAIKEIGFKREKGKKNVNSPIALFPCNHTDVSYKDDNGLITNKLTRPFKKQNLPLMIKLVMDEKYNISWTEKGTWWENKFIDIYPSLSRERLNIKPNVDWLTREEIDDNTGKWEPHTIIGVYNGGNYNSVPASIDKETQTFLGYSFNVHPVAPFVPEDIIKWEGSAIQEGCSFIMGEPKKPAFNKKKKNANSYTEIPQRFVKDRPTQADQDAGCGMYSQQPDTTMLGNKKDNFRLKRKINIDNYNS